MVTSKEVTVEILVEEILSAHSHDVVTLDELTCYNNNMNYIIFSNLNFAYVKKYLTNNTRYIIYKSTQEIKALRGTKGPWQWQCKLYVHWNGSNVDYKFEVKVLSKKLEKNETNKSTSSDFDEKMLLHEHYVPAKTKPVTKGKPKNVKHVDKPTSDLNEDVGAAKNRNRTETDKIIPKKNQKKGEEKQTTKPKSSSGGKTEQTPRDQKDKNKKPTEQNDRMNTDIGVKTLNTLKNVNDSSHVAYGEISKSTTWVIFVVASVVIFIVGLGIGAICRQPRTVVGTTAPMPDPPEQKHDQTEEHIYEEVSFEHLSMH